MELGEKKLFISIAAGGLVLLAVLAGAAWYLIGPRLSGFQEDLPVIVGVGARRGVAAQAPPHGVVYQSARDRPRGR